VTTLAVTKIMFVDVDVDVDVNVLGVTVVVF